MRRILSPAEASRYVQVYRHKTEPKRETFKMKIFYLALLLVISNVAISSPLDECVTSKLKETANVETFTREGRVRCEGAGFSASGRFQQAEVCFAAAPGWTIDGNVRIDIVSDNRGRAGQANYVKTSDDVISRVCVPISCKSPSQLFGPGAWMAIRLSGTSSKVVSDQDKEDATRFCLDTLSH